MGYKEVLICGLFLLYCFSCIHRLIIWHRHHQLELHYCQMYKKAKELIKNYAEAMQMEREFSADLIIKLKALNQAFLDIDELVQTDQFLDSYQIREKLTEILAKTAHTLDKID